MGRQTGLCRILQVFNNSKIVDQTNMEFSKTAKEVLEAFILLHENIFQQRGFLINQDWKSTIL